MRCRRMRDKAFWAMLRDDQFGKRNLDLAQHWWCSFTRGRGLIAIAIVLGAERLMTDPRGRPCGPMAFPASFNSANTKEKSNLRTNGLLLKLNSVNISFVRREQSSDERQPRRDLPLRKIKFGSRGSHALVCTEDRKYLYCRRSGRFTTPVGVHVQDTHVSGHAIHKQTRYSSWNIPVCHPYFNLKLSRTRWQ